MNPIYEQIAFNPDVPDPDIHSPNPTWIPISEQQPEDGQMVIVTLASGIVTELQYLGGRFNGIFVHKVGEVLAWQPLPLRYHPEQS